VHEVHPTATFAVTDSVDPAKLTGTPVTVPVAGELTLAGTTRPVQTRLAVARTAGGVDVSGSVPVTSADHGIQAPRLGFARMDHRGAVELPLHFTR
jgi:polyisoprenoid-binding protein YceI